jgi:predicted RNA-binding Zn-ribbon protein involved in translation (DUF1610 family)
MIRFRCHYCPYRIDLDDDSLGSSFTCPKCGRVSTVRSFRDETPAISSLPPPTKPPPGPSRAETPAMIAFRCPHCPYSIEMDDDFAGGPFTCPKCGRVSMVPTPVAALWQRWRWWVVGAASATFALLLCACVLFQSLPRPTRPGVDLSRWLSSARQPGNLSGRTVYTHAEFESQFRGATLDEVRSVLGAPDVIHDGAWQYNRRTKPKEGSEPDAWVFLATLGGRVARFHYSSDKPILLNRDGEEKAFPPFAGPKR